MSVAVENQPSHSSSTGINDSEGDVVLALDGGFVPLRYVAMFRCYCCIEKKQN